MKIVITANGELTAERLRAALPVRPDLLIAADGGVAPLLAAGLRPDILIGDFDSAPAQAVEFCRMNGVSVLPYPAEKDETDLELALNQADEILRRAGAAAGTAEILLLGAGGGRTDHLMANLALMLNWARRGRRVRMLNQAEECWVAGSGREEITGAAGVLLSILPMSAEAKLSCRGLRYPLRRQILRQDSPRGVSNLMLGARAEVEIHSGWILLVKTNAAGLPEADRK
ncbi:MAG: thiamine diphosphokinase [Gracilibacteraceae bacterium]|jgi:thiamine pyrophosphokinase|nr:thiamine diphosphokinase [Gracilibacteraceae bacterium]